MYVVPGTVATSCRGVPAVEPVDVVPEHADVVRRRRPGQRAGRGGHLADGQVLRRGRRGGVRAGVRHRCDHCQRVRPVRALTEAVPGDQSERVLLARPKVAGDRGAGDGPDAGAEDDVAELLVVRDVVPGDGAAAGRGGRPGEGDRRAYGPRWRSGSWARSAGRARCSAYWTALVGVVPAGAATDTAAPRARGATRGSRPAGRRGAGVGRRYGDQRGAEHRRRQHDGGQQTRPHTAEQRGRANACHTSTMQQQIDDRQRVSRLGRQPARLMPDFLPNHDVPGDR